MVVKTKTAKKNVPTVITVPKGCNLITYFEELARTSDYTEKMCSRLSSEGNITVKESSQNTKDDNEQFIVKHKNKQVFILEVDEGTDPDILTTSLNYARILKDSDKTLVREKCTVCIFKRKVPCPRSALVDSILNL